MTYDLEGDLLEVCDCKVLCPCWIGEDADNGTCDAIVGYHMQKGTIGDTDVRGLTLCAVAHIPGNVLQGNWRVAIFVDDRATKQQEEALLNVWMGKLGGPVADFGKLIGEVVSVQRAPILFDPSPVGMRIEDKNSTSPRKQKKRRKIAFRILPENISHKASELSLLDATRLPRRVYYPW